MSGSVQNERLRVLLQGAGLRPTRQRLALADLLLDGCHRHVTAEQVHAGLRKRKAKISLATVYNALHQFTDAGLLHEVMIDPERIYFDTNTDAHHHFFDESNGSVMDIAAKQLRLVRMPKAPRGRKIDRVDIVIRLRAKSTRKG